MLKALRRFADARTVEGRIVSAILVITLALMAWDVNALSYALANDDSAVAAQAEDSSADEKAAQEAAEREAAEKAAREAEEKAAAEQAAKEKAEREAAEKAAAEEAAKAEKAKQEAEAKAAKEAEEKAAREAAEKAAEEEKVAAAEPAVRDEEPAEVDDAQEESPQYPAAVLVGKAGDITVKIDAPEGALPAGAQLRVYQVPVTAEDMEKDKNAGKLHLQGVTAEDLAQLVKDEAKKTPADYRAIDIAIVDKDSREVQPEKAVNITFMDTDLEGDDIRVYRIDEEKVSKVKTLEADEDTQSFDAKDLYTYFIAAMAKKKDEAPTPVADETPKPDEAATEEPAADEPASTTPAKDADTDNADKKDDATPADDDAKQGDAPKAPDDAASTDTAAGDANAKDDKPAAPAESAEPATEPASETATEPAAEPAPKAESSIQVNYRDMDGNLLAAKKAQTFTVESGAAYKVDTALAGHALSRIERDGEDVGRRISYVAQAGQDVVYDVYYQVNLTIKANDKAKEYDGKALLSYGADDATATGLLEGHELTYIGFKGVQTAVGSSPTIATIARISGPKSSDFYRISYEAGTLTVREPAPATQDAADAQEGTQPAEDAAAQQDPNLPRFDLTAESGGGTYNGREYGLNNVRASLAAAVIEYRVGAGAWSEEAPTATNVSDSLRGTISVRATCEGYATAQVDGLSIVVEPRAITVSARNATKVYGDNDPAYQVNASGMTGGDTAAVLSYWFDREPGEDVGEYEVVPVGATTQGNYEITFRPAKLRITQATAVVAPDHVSKVYGQDDPQAFTASVVGLKLDDTDEVISYEVKRQPGENAGTYTLSARGDRSQGNYRVQFYDSMFTIKKAPVTVAVADVSKTYGTADPALTATVEGLLGDDQVQYTISRAEGENVGTYKVTATGDADQGNYAVEFIDGTLAIARAKATVSAADATKAYGDVDPAFTVVVDGLVTGDDESAISYTAAREPGEDVGEYARTIGGAQIQGNYELSFEPGTLTIEPAAATVAVDNASKVYGDLDPAFKATVQGLKNGETAKSAGIAFTLSRAKGEDAGEYAITATGAARQGNYRITYQAGAFTIDRASVTVAALNAGKQAGADDPQLSAAVSGLKGADTAAILAFELSRAEGEEAGTYAIEATGEAEQGNYSITYAAGTFEVTAADALAVYPAPIEAEYTGEPQGAPATVNAPTGTTIEYSTDDGVTWSEDVPTRTDAGTTTVQVRATNPNLPAAAAEYAITVLPKHVTVKADDEQKVYGEADPLFVYRVEGLVAGDEPTRIRVSDVARDAGEDVGTYAITPTGKASQGNYQVAFEASVLTINPRAVTVTGDDASKIYGQEDPQFSATVEGVLDGEAEDAISFEVKRSDEANQNVGVYAVMPLGNATQGNYAVTYIAGSFTIEPAQATVAADGIQKAYGQEDPELSATVDGLVDEDTLVYTITRQPGEEPGSYGIEVTGEANQGNYRVEFAGNTFVIEPVQDDAAPAEPAEEPAPAADEPVAKQVFTDEFEDADGNVTTVTVEAPAGTFPEGTTMEAAPIQSEDVRDRVEAAIDDPEVRGAITKMVAVDITFFDAEGNEVEPEGNIKVRISSDTVDEMRNPLLVHVPDAG